MRIIVMRSFPNNKWLYVYIMDSFNLHELTFVPA